MNRTFRSLATLAVAAAVTLTAAALVAAREDSPEPQVITTETKTVVVRKGEDQVEKAQVEVKRGPAEKAGKAVDRVVVKDRMEPAKKEEAKAEAKGEAKAAVKVEKKAVAAVKRAVPQQNLDPWIQQMTPQLRPMVRAQLHLIAVTCSPTIEQRKEFAAEGERVLKEVARDCAAMQMGQKPGNTMSDPNQLIAAALGVALKDKLQPEQWAKFETETRARVEARKHLVVQNLVSSLDDELVLATDQRAAIVEALEKNYDESWCSTLQVLMYGTQFFPSIPDKLITPSLTANQLTAWKKRTRNGSMAWWNFGHNGNAVLLDDDDFNAVIAAPAQAAEAKKDQ